MEETKTEYTIRTLKELSQSVCEAQLEKEREFLKKRERAKEELYKGMPLKMPFLALTPRQLSQSVCEAQLEKEREFLKKRERAKEELYKGMPLKMPFLALTPRQTVFQAEREKKRESFKKQEWGKEEFTPAQSSLQEEKELLLKEKNREQKLYGDNLQIRPFSDTVAKRISQSVWEAEQEKEREILKKLKTGKDELYEDMSLKKPSLVSTHRQSVLQAEREKKRESLKKRERGKDELYEGMSFDSTPRQSSLQEEKELLMKEKNREQKLYGDTLQTRPFSDTVAKQDLYRRVPANQKKKERTELAEEISQRVVAELTCEMAHLRVQPIQQSKATQTDPAAWEKCIGQDFETQTESLLSDGKLPNQALLNEACLKYKRTNPCVKAICRNICLYIKDKSKSFLDVWAAYPYKKGDTSYGNTIVFVILTDDKEDNEVGNFNTYKRNVTKIITKKENEAIKTKEKEDPPSPHEIKNLETCLKENGRLLMEKHSNLTRVTASWYRSSGYGTDQFSVQRKPCIALYIHVKGYVPIDEEPFRAEIGRYPVDVREGVSILCVGEPHDYHRNVKMGCAICGAKQGNQIFAGTLGAFLEFKDDNNVYAITCAHVLFPGERLKNMIESGNINCKDTNEIVFQPLSNNVRESCGIVEGVVYSQGGNGVPGMEIAVIKMDNERHPDAGTFPNDSDLLEKGFGPDKPLEFFSGRCCAPEHLSYMRSVYKYGCMTKLTMGTCRVIGASVRTRVLTSTSFSIVMHDQIEIESVGNTPFADFGDSGAVVLTYHGTELIAVGILEGKAEMDDVYLMTPISPILKQLTKDANRECRLKPFRTYNQPIIDPRLLDEEGINQKLTKNFEDHKKELDELRQEVRMKFKDQKTEISQELKESLERHGDEIRNQNKELKQQLEVIQNLLQASTRQNTP